MTQRGSTNDDEVVAAQIGRPTRATTEVVFRCELGLPVVVRMPPVLPTGEPFPTRYWLTCPLAHRRVARLEADSGVARFDRRLQEDPEFREAFERANERHARDRDAAIAADVSLAPRGGVGGIRHGVKCLHAHLADELASGDNPVGGAIRGDVLPLVCASACVEVDGDGRARKSTSWREPAHVVRAPETR